ncbi:uncharacterized protein LOC111717786 [Eurytemora carolleeae]|uniref:uncharacterized protein LOC111717242 n=1 Tax=Eurytemora carolleeae TaxID=1294199 RepID=UPI000C774611|nr:uncharacterized protein LOC111717242 [Eurytemora carolleeae]XP_023349001.1 uncharacterized protein LOC111717786 [Eurytemora carolleeae]|eukprot:XP_023348522.1 uncharacterized protein LOC111717242 [Eurytemora affinis]
MLNYFDNLSAGEDCLAWCYIFVPYFGHPLFIGGNILLFVLTTAIFQHGIFPFGIAIFNLVFWCLTGFQCPLPCKTYSDTCDLKVDCWDNVLLLSWPLLLGITLVCVYICHVRGIKRILVYPNLFARFEGRGRLPKIKKKDPMKQHYFIQSRMVELNVGL